MDTATKPNGMVQGVMTWGLIGAGVWVVVPLLDLLRAGFGSPVAGKYFYELIGRAVISLLGLGAIAWALEKITAAVPLLQVLGASVGTTAPRPRPAPRVMVELRAVPVRLTCWNCTHFEQRSTFDRTKGYCRHHERRTFAYEVCDRHAAST